MNARVVLWWLAMASLSSALHAAASDARGEALAGWINQRGAEVWGAHPQQCDDHTFARRLYLDVLGRVPSVSELQDFEALGEARRRLLVDQLVFGEGPRAELYQRLSARNFARHWRRILVPPGTATSGPAEPIENWLRGAFAEQMPYDEMMRRLADISAGDAAGGYYQILGSLPENYAGHLSRVMLGVRIECAQCHDHPFTDWSQEDFWGLAAFYGDLARAGEDAATSSATNLVGTIRYEGQTYSAKLLWADEPLEKSSDSLRRHFARWLTDAENPNFSSTAVNRVWQYLIGRGLYADVENLDLASADQRAFADDLGGHFAASGFDLRQLIAGICKSAWYQSVSGEMESAAGGFARPLKVLSPEQLFDSLEQALLLPVSRIDPLSPRWSGERNQLVSRLSETVGTSPEDYSAGIPQALMLMNGKLTGDATDLERSRLLRAVVDSPFLEGSDRVRTLYLAVLTREPSLEESEAFAAYLDAQPTTAARENGYGEILWALLNSPEFVLCR